MHILLTGATGFVGQVVLRQLLAEGHTVVAVVRNAAKARERFPAVVEIVSWGTNDDGPQNSLPLSARLPKDIDGVIHLAGESIAGGLWTKSRKRKLWNSRIEGTRKLVDALREAGQASGRFPSVFVSASGMGYHGDAGDRAVKTTDAPGDDFLGSMAAAWEDEARKAEGFGARVACVRMGMVLGAQGGALPPQLLVYRLGLGAVMGSGRQYWPWIHVEDAAGLFVEAVKNPSVVGPIFGAAGVPLTQREFARTLGSVLRRPVLFRIPKFALRLGLGEMADLFLHGQKVDKAPDVRFNNLAEALQDILARNR